MTEHPSETPIEFHFPDSVTISDGLREIVLSRVQERGDVLRVAVARSAGKISVVTVSGWFHGDGRQGTFNELTRLSQRYRINQRQDQHLVLHFGHPRFSVRGYISNLSGPNWSPRRPTIFEFEIQFSVREEPRQMAVMLDPGEIMESEGRPYVRMIVPSDTTTVEDLAYEIGQRTYRDYQDVRELIRHNRMTPLTARAVSGEVKVPPR
jgi:hypothetical protein